MRCTCRKKENNSRRNGKKKRKNAPPRRESPPSRASSRERARSRTRSRRRGAWGGKQRAEREGKFMEPVRGFAEEKKDDDERSRGRRKKEENVTSQGEGFPLLGSLYGSLPRPAFFPPRIHAPGSLARFRQRNRRVERALLRQELGKRKPWITRRCRRRRRFRAR